MFHGDAFQGLDLFDRHATLRHYWDSLVDSYAIDWLGRSATAAEVAQDGAVTEAVRRALARAAAGRWEAFDAPGSGADWRLADAELVGSALVAGETVVHLQLFPAGPRAVPPLPFPRAWWVDPGRVLGGCFPGTPDPARSREMLAALVDAGVRTVVNLQEPGERGAGGRPFPDYRAVLTGVAAERGVEVEFHRFPIPDCGVPDPAVMSEIQRVLRRTVDEGRLAYVHCWGGHGRTGTVGGCWLVDGGLTPTEAFRSMKVGRAYDSHLRKEDAPQTDAQRAFVEAWAARRAPGPRGS